MADDPIKVLDFSNDFTVTESAPGEYGVALTNKVPSFSGDFTVTSSAGVPVVSVTNKAPAFTSEFTSTPDGNGRPTIDLAKKVPTFNTTDFTVTAGVNGNSSVALTKKPPAFSTDFTVTTGSGGTSTVDLAKKIPTFNTTDFVTTPGSNGNSSITLANKVPSFTGDFSVTTDVNGRPVVALGAVAKQPTFGDGLKTAVSGGVTNVTLDRNLPVEVISGTTYTLTAADSGKIKVTTDPSPVIITVPNNLPKGWWCWVIQRGTGQVAFQPATGASVVNFNNHNASAGRYAKLELVCEDNPGSAAEVLLNGQTSSAVTITTYVTPSDIDVGTQNFEFVGHKPKQDYQFRLYSNGVYRFEIHQGDRESLSAPGGIFDDDNISDRCQFDGGGNTPDFHPANWVSGGQTSGQINYLIRTRFTWTPVQNIPGSTQWNVMWEWHHRNQQLGWLNPQHAPITISCEPRGSSFPLILFFRNWPSLASAVSPNQPTEVQTRIIPNIAIGHTYTFEEEVQFHMTNGIYRMWVDGVLMFERTNVMVGYPNTPHWPEFGIYRGTCPEVGVTEYTFPDPAKRFEQIYPANSIASAYFANSSSTLLVQEKNSINTFIADLQAAGIVLNGASSGIWLWNVSGLDAARRDLLHPTLQSTLNGTVAFDPLIGITPNGSLGSYYDSGSTMTAADDCLFMVQGTVGSGGNVPPIGDSTYNNALGRFDGFFEARMANSGTSYFDGNDGGDGGAGFIAAQRINATQVEVWQDVPYGSGIVKKGPGTLNESAIVSSNNLRFGQVSNQPSNTRIVMAGKLPMLTATQMNALKNACLSFQARQASYIGSL